MYSSFSYFRKSLTVTVPYLRAILFDMFLNPIAYSYFYNYKPSTRILRQHRVLRNLRKNKDIVITEPDKGNRVVILDRKLYNNAIEEIISDTSKFEKLSEEPTLSFTTTFFT